MGRERPPEEEPPGAPEWVVTFTDMISLLVTFFVLLMTFSSMEEYDLLRVKGILMGSGGTIEHMNGDREVEAPENDLLSGTDPVAGAVEPPERPVEEITDAADEGRRRDPAKKHVDMNRVADGLLVRFEASEGFAPGSAEINPALAQRLDELADLMRHHPHRLVVEGHTDDGFRPTARFIDAEALALARAEQAALQLIRKGGVEPSRVQVTAHADRVPRVRANTPEARRENRRVEVRIIALDPSRAAQIDAKWRQERLDGER